MEGDPSVPVLATPDLTLLPAILERVPDCAVYILDADGVVRTWNRGAELLFGFTADEVVGRRHALLFPPAERKRGEPGSLLARAADSGSVEEAGWRQRRDGARFWAGGSVTALPGEDGGARAYCCLLRDLTADREREEALLASEHRFRIIADRAPVMLWITDPAGKCTYINQSWTEFTGMSLDESLGFGWLRGVHPDDRLLAEEAFMDARVVQGELRVEYRLRHRSGEYRWVIDYAAPHYGPGNEYLGYIGCVLDITDLKRIEEALRRSELQNRAIVNALPDFVFRLSSDGVFVDFHGAPGAGPYADPTNFLWRSISEVFTPDVADLVRQELHATLQLGGTRQFEYELTLGGACRQFEGRMVRCEHSDVLCISRDVTELREAELLRSRMAAVLEGSPDLVGILDPEGRLLFINGAGRQMLGLGPEEAGEELLHHEMYLGAAESRSMTEGLPAAIRTGLWCAETTLLARDGRQIPAWQVLVAHHDAAGELRFLSTTIRDLTQQRMLETQLRQSQKMEAIGQLAGGVAHDFNNLLTVIIGYCDLLLLRATAGSQDLDMLRGIRQAGEQATSLTRQLLAFSRRQILEPKVLCLNDTIANTERILRRLIGEDIAVRSLPEPDLRAVRVDPGQMEQVLLNLAVNARDAMPQGGTLTIETGNLEWDEEYCRTNPECKPGRYAWVSLADTGCGIPPENLPHIFEPFFTTKELGRGTGLGLAVVFGIVRQSEGHIQVESAVGKGTKFTVILPAVDAAPSRAGEAEGVPAGGGTETILVVEDDEQVRRLARLSLESRGYRVLEADSGKAALELAVGLTEPIHLTITDVVMPVMSGHQVAAALRERFPDLRVLFTSGYTEDAVARHGALGPKNFLQKPFSPQTLARRVRELLDEPSGG